MAEFDSAQRINDDTVAVEVTDVMTGDRDKNRFLLYQLKMSIHEAKQIDIVVSFLMESGVKMLLKDLQQALDRGVSIRILTGNYLGITQPSALYLIKYQLGERVDLRFYNEPNRSFHAKSYIFHLDNHSEIYIGSSNISRSALTSGIEWNYRFDSRQDKDNYQKFYTTFKDLFENHSIVIDDNELKRYAKNWHRPSVTKDLERYDVNEESIDTKVRVLYEPRGAQIEALCALENSREEGAMRGLVQAATGVGKTYLAAFDSRNYQRVLFVAHREEILKQAAISFHNVRNTDEYGFFGGEEKCTDKPLIFASVATLGKKEYLAATYFEPDYFDYIVIDEFHHSVNEQYRRIVEYFKPKFLLGLTATPDRMDGKNIYELCEYNVPYEISLQDSINRGLLVPFHYYGIYDDTDYSEIHIVRGKYNEKELNETYIGNVKRFDLIYKYYCKYESKRALGFCCSREHAEKMAKEFSGRGIPSVAVYSNADGEFSENRTTAIENLKAGNIKVIFSVDMFNEGVDIPSVDMVMFLRPTESPIIFLQQLGRGLRKCKGKNYLNVLDFIGNYEKAGRVRFLLNGKMQDRPEEWMGGRPCEYPDECLVDFDMKLIDLFREMDHKNLKVKDQIRIEYYRVKDLLGKRPTRMELFTYMDDGIYNLCIKHSKDNIFKKYLDYLKELGELSEEEKEIYNGVGRIDFEDPGAEAAESYYVGRVGIARNGSEPVVIDWRAPIASVYYENSTGRCRYVVKKEGTYEIDLKRKRTYEIADDTLIDYFDSDVVANDELLTKYLAQSKKAVLGEIIATIQQEQNTIIRRSPKTNLIVQGVAGSGKTTVAMHRISYILYNYEQFRPEDFYIIGSNRILLNYITGVLPDLDVYGIAQMTMEQLFTRLLYEDWDPLIHRIGTLDRKDELARIKGSYGWFHDLEDFCNYYEKKMISREDVRIEKTNALLLDRDRIETYLTENSSLSMQSKINILNETLLAKLENEFAGRYVTYSPAEKNELHRMYRYYFGKDEWKGSIFELYNEFLLEQQKRGHNIELWENTYDVYDLAALAYLYKRIKETDGIREASHVIIDEAQDFGMMAYGVLEYCLRGCTYTIMGDVSQNIHYGYGLNDWEDLKKLILTGDFDTFGLLKKSYRNTVEISDFATDILRHGDFPVYPVEPIIRHGNEVKLLQCSKEEEIIIQTAEEIRRWQAEGHETIAVICHDEEEAIAVSQQLGKKVPLADCNLETTEFGSGVMVLPVEYTKGLEFDAVLLYHPSEEHYPSEDQYVKLLYVATTRALHELSVVHLGDLTGLIAKPVDKKKRMHSLEAESLMQPRVKQYEKKEHTTKELKVEDARDAHKEMERRGYLGPKRIEATKKEQVAHTRQAAKPLQSKVPSASSDKTIQQGKPQQGTKRQNTDKPKNSSPYQFGDTPDNSVLRPKGHSRIDSSIRWVKKTKRYIDLASNYGTLRIMPVRADMIRVCFLRGQTADFAQGYWNFEPEETLTWSAKESKTKIMITTEILAFHIEKKTGAIQYLDQSGNLLLAEQATEPRQLETESQPQQIWNHFEIWNYFDWGRSEKLYAKGILDDNLERMNQKVRYISFGNKALRMPLLISERGYGIGIAAENAVMCSTIPMHGQYIYTQGMQQSDYYFLYGGNTQQTISLYKQLTK